MEDLTTPAVPVTASRATPVDPRVVEYLDEASAEGLPGFLGIQVVDVSAGRVLMRLPVATHLLSSLGHLHGGVTAAFMDHLLGAAVLPVVESGQWPATLEFKINYLAPVQGGVLEGTAEMLALTRRTAVVRIDVRNEGRIVAAGQATVMVVDARA